MIEELGISPKPSWLDIPEERTYWEVNGDITFPWWKLWGRNEPGFVCIYETKEEAEADAVAMRQEQLGKFIWDGEPARPVTLSKAMREAREDGQAGVDVVGFRNGCWVTLARYRADEPLPGEEIC